MCWINWKIKPPKPGDFIYVRDIDAKEDWEIGWCVGEGDDTKVVLPNDPSLSQMKFDEWQLIPAPVTKT